MPLFSTLSDIFNQLRSFVSAVEDTAYVRPLTVLDGATLGQHLRHATEFYICLLEALSLKRPAVNYESRRRNSLLETSKEAALSALTDIEARLLSYPKDRPVELLVDTTKERNMSIPSSFYRECAYNIEHSIHHMALLRVGAKEACPELQLPETFGVAKGTIAYRKQINIH